jgi:hypothetical protein
MLCEEYSSIYSVRFYFVLGVAIMIGLLVFDANFSSISAVWWREQIIYIRHLEDPKK